jgi:TatD DNase family protein
VIDSHCHLAGEEFAADLEAVVARATGAGVTSALCILAAENDQEIAAAAIVQSAWPATRFAVGVHPHQAGRAGDLQGLHSLVRGAAQARGACAIGEIGLDYHYDFSPRPVQHEVFARQIALARDLGLPVIIHTREATDDTFRLLREHGGGAVRGVFHCFTGDLEMARQALDLDFHISFAGIVTFPKAASLRDVAAFVPEARLLAETDAPYLAPVPYRGKRNEPAYVGRVYDVLGELRGAPRGQIVEAVARNFDELFRSPARGVGADA